MRSEAINELVTALAKAQGLIEAPKFNRVNPHFKSRYADGAAIREAIRKPLADNGLSLTYTNEWTDSGAYVMRATLWHSSGQWVASEFPLPPNVKPQDLGSHITYGRRYLACEILNVYAEEDDDGNGTQTTNGKSVTVTTDRLNAAQVEELTAAIVTNTIAVKDFLIWVRTSHPQVQGVVDIPATFFQAAMDKIDDVVAARERKKKTTPITDSEGCG